VDVVCRYADVLQIGARNAQNFDLLKEVGIAKKPVVLVGKGVTFDAGGISLKPSAGMAEMKMDMSGAGAVIGTMSAAAELRLPVHLVGLVPATENLPGGGALKPGDIVRHYNGMTTEVDNTDAEGRLILADALAYAGRYDPALIIDLATLTGAVVVALGHFATGMMGNNPVALQEMHDAGERTYERVWELPLFEEYDRLIRSDIADIKNVGGRWAGAITAGMFLKRFVGDRRWIHLQALELRARRGEAAARAILACGIDVAGMVRCRHERLASPRHARRIHPNPHHR